MKGKDNYLMKRIAKGELCVAREKGYTLDLMSNIQYASQYVEIAQVVVTEIDKAMSKFVTEISSSRKEMKKECHNKIHGLEEVIRKVKESNETIITTYVGPLPTETRREIDQSINESYSPPKLPKESEIMFG